MRMHHSPYDGFGARCADFGVVRVVLKAHPSAWPVSSGDGADGAQHRGLSARRLVSKRLTPELGHRLFSAFGGDVPRLCRSAIEASTISPIGGAEVWLARISRR